MTFLIPVAAIGFLSFALALRSLRQRLETSSKDNKAKEMGEGILLSIQVPKFNEQGPVAAEMMFSALHGLLKEEDLTPHLSFEMAASAEGIKFYVYTPEDYEKFVKSQIYAQYPTAEINKTEDYTQNQKFSGLNFSFAEVTLAKPYFFPIKTFPDFEVDPLAAITSAVGDLGKNEQAWFQLLIRPIPDVWQKVGYDYVKEVKEGQPPKVGLFEAVIKQMVGDLVGLIPQILTSILSGPPPLPTTSAPPERPKPPPRLTSGQELGLKSIEGKLAKLGFEIGLRLVGVAPTEKESDQKVESLLAVLKQFSTAHLNSFVRASLSQTQEQVLENYRMRALPDEMNLFVLNTEELASLFHLPSISVATSSIAWTSAKKAEPPLILPIAVEPLIGVATFRDRLDQKISFGVKRDDRRRHLYIIGKTGTGKTTLMRNMILSDIKQGEGVALLDPHGDLFDYVLEAIPPERVNDVVILDPSDFEYPVAMNMLEMFDPTQRALVASGLVDVFRVRFAFSWGPRLEHILRNILLTLLEIPNTTLLSILRIVTDRAYRKYITHLLTDPVLTAFWENEFENILRNERLATEAIAPIQNRIGPFLATSTIRNIVGQARSSINLPEIMNGGKILLVNLSKGKIGEDNSNIFGGMLISRLWFAAMTRASMSEEERRDFFVYVDEFQNFATPTFVGILSEARKYRLNLTLAHQYIAQVPKEVQDAVFGNVGTMITFTLGQQDAFILAREFKPTFIESDLINLDKFHIYLKLMIDLTQSAPFSARTLSPRFEPTGLKEQVAELSRKTYATEKDLVEERIKRWSQKQFAPGMDDREVEKQRKERSLVKH